MAGTCPQNAPFSCVQGTTWSPNGVSAYTQQSFLHALTLVHLTDPLFWMHHAVSDFLYVTVGTNVAVLDNR